MVMVMACRGVPRLVGACEGFVPPCTRPCAAASRWLYAGLVEGFAFAQAWGHTGLAGGLVGWGAALLHFAHAALLF